MLDDNFKEGEVLLGRNSSGGEQQTDFNDGAGEYQLELDLTGNGAVSTGRGDHSSHSSARAACFVVTAAIMASLGGILFGYDIGIISGAILQLKEKFCLSCLDQELIVSAMLIGAVCGSLTGGFLIDFFGRRCTLIVNAAVFLLGALILTFSPSFAILVVGRVLVGFAVSVSATGECIYISEIAPAKRRGLLVSLNELGITLGLLLAYLQNFLFIDIKDGWRWMFGLSAIPAVVQGVGMFFLPPSPRYLMLKKKEDQAEKVLQKLRGCEQVDRELSSIRISIASEKSRRCLDLLSSSDNMRGRMMIGIGLVFFQQFTGQPNVLYYAPTIFETVGFQSDSAATLATVGLGLVKVFMTIIALCCVDKFGRRKFLISGAMLMAASILTLGIVCNIEQSKQPLTTCQNSAVCAQNSSHVSTAKNLNLSNSDSHSHDFNVNFNFTHGRNLSTAYGPDVNQSFNGTFALTVISNTGHKNASDPSKPGKSSMFLKVVGFTALMFYVAAYGFSFGPVTWLVLSEIYPATVKGRAIAMATVFNWGTNLVVTFTFLDMMSALGVSWTFVLYSGICVLSVVFIFCFVPETKNRSLEQVSQDLKKRPPMVRMMENCRGLFCLKQAALRVHSSYTRVDESEAL